MLMRETSSGRRVRPTSKSRRHTLAWPAKGNNLRLVQFNAQIGYICEPHEMMRVGHVEENVQLTVFVYSVNIF